MSDTDNDLFDGDGGDDSSDDDALSGDSSKSGKDPKSTDKRISDLQSKADKETARANKAETQLNRLLAAAKDPDDAGEGKGSSSGAPDAATTVMIDMAKMFVFQQHPKLAEYGLSTSDLNGSNPGEIAQSAAGLVARFEKIETQARNKVLADNGLAPELAADQTVSKKQVDYSKMSAEDFKKTLDAAMAGRL